MSLEFLLLLLAVIGFVFLAVWVYARVFDFVDDWKRNRILGHMREQAVAAMRREDDRAKPGWRRFYDFAGPPADVEARLPPMAPPGRYGMDSAPSGPPDGLDRGGSRSKAGRQEE